MSKLIWDEEGSRLYESGIDRGVFYPQNGPGVAWNGLVSVREAPSGSEVSVRYWDGIPFLQQRAGESYSAEIEAYTYPSAFDEYSGLSEHTIAQQRRKSFSFSYRTNISSDLNPALGYKIHLVYNALAAPTQGDYEAINTDADATTFSWNVTTTPILVSGHRSSSHLVVDTTRTYPSAILALEGVLYGDAENAPRFPTLEETIEIFEAASIVRITDHGDGTWTATGPDDVVYLTGPSTFEIDWPSAVYIDDESYSISSL